MLPTLVTSFNSIFTTFPAHQLVALFFVYSFLGWCSEVTYAALTTGKFSNRGFLNGPLCPIYGFGILIVVILLSPISSSFLLLFLGSILLATALEYVSGLALETFFHARWWDYSDKPFNVQGYICPGFSVLWGIACLIIVRIIHPTVYFVLSHLPTPLVIAFAALFTVICLLDLAATVTAMIHLNKQLAIITQTAKSIHAVSDKLGEGLYENTVAAMAKGSEVKEAALTKGAEARDTVADTMEKLDQQRVSLGEKVGQLQVRALESAEQRISDTAERLTRRREAAQERTAAAAEELAIRRTFDDLPREDQNTYNELMGKLKSALSQKNFFQERILRDLPDLRPTRDRGALLALQRFRQAPDEEEPDAEAVLAPQAESGKPAVIVHPVPRLVGTFLAGFAAGGLVVYLILTLALL